MEMSLIKQDTENVKKIRTKQNNNSKYMYKREAKQKKRCQKLAGDHLIMQKSTESALV